MNEEVIVPNGDATDAESVENTEVSDDNDIRELLTAQLAESEDQPPEQESEQQSEEQTSEDGAESPTVEDDVTAAPQSWTEDEREAWEDVPQSVRDAVQRTEKEHQKAIRSDAELQKVITPLAERLEGSGVHVDQYVENLLKADNYITQDPLGAVMSIVQRHGLQDQLAQHLQPQQPTQQGQAPAEDSRIADLEFKIAVSEETNKWNAFVAEHPDAGQMNELIAAKIGANPNLTYEGAYNQAKEMLGKLNGNDAAANEAANIEKATKQTNKANRLNLPKGRSGSGTPQESSGSLRDDLEANARKLGMRLN